VPALVLLAAQANAQMSPNYANVMYGMHHDERPVANASWIAPRADVDTQTVVYSGATSHGYLVHPKDGKNWPAVVMIHEWWGLNDNVRMEARRLAGEGYQVLAVDLYHGKSATTADEARNLVVDVAHDPNDARVNLSDAIAYVRAHGAKRVGIIGWCFGGGWSIQAALESSPRVDADVAYYGSPELDHAKLGNMPPFLGLYGGADGGIPVAQVHEMESSLESLHKIVEIKIYDGAQHAFANPSGQHYDQAAADDAWQRTTKFFAKYLKG
jgi:carboxymethylenebutenolidase